MEKEPSYIQIAIDRARVVQRELAGSSTSRLDGAL
jgi:hypothetical protein